MIQFIGGWLFANGFRASALEISEPTRTFGVWVRSVDRNLVTLGTIAPMQNIGHPGTLGMFWEDGYAHVGEVVNVEALTVTRRYASLTESAHPVCDIGDLEACPPVDLESYAFPSDPSDRGMGFETIEYKGPLGPLGAWMIPSGEGKRWVIHIHGWTAERREAIRFLPAYANAGVTSLVIDYRNDPGTDRDPSGRYRFGVTEWEDVEAAITYALDAGASEILLAGYSTGAAHAMSFLEESDLRDHIVGVVFDSPNLILADVVRANTLDAQIPILNIRMGQLMKEVGLWLADLRWKIDWDRTNYVQRARSILTVPTLVFHGTSDQRVPIAVSRQLEATAPAVVTLVEAPAAGHVMSWNANPDEYERRLGRFLDLV